MEWPDSCPRRKLPAPPPASLSNAVTSSVSALEHFSLRRALRAPASPSGQRRAASRAGEGLGEATDALLWGDADPCGRLPETWPLRLEDTPCYLDFPGDGVTADYREGVYVGYRWYDARKMPVRWPFGHGLSYTGYVYRGAALDADTLTPGGTVTARVTVKNSGAMRGAEVVQLYVADATGAPVPGGRVPQALRRFAKIDLQPGEEQEIVFTLTPQDISRYSPELHAWCAAPGRYEIRIGHSSRDIRAVLALQYADAKI